VTGTASRTRRRRLWKLLVPGFIVLYLVMIPLNSVLESSHVEVFPFFKWKLFTQIPDWDSFEYGLVIDAIDGESSDETFYLIPSDDVRDWKALRRVAIACAKDRGCEEAVTGVLYPIIERALGERSIDFSIIKADVDLRELQDNIDDFADGRLTRTDFFRPSEVIAQWNIRTGRLDVVMDGG
jgi:hypothetical protein